MSRTWQLTAGCLAACGLNAMAIGLAAGQTARQVIVPPGVVSEQADDAAVGSAPRRMSPQGSPAAVAAGTTTARATATGQPVAGAGAAAPTQAVPATNGAVAAGGTTAVNSAITTGTVSGIAAAPITAENTLAADFGLWLTTTPTGALSVADLSASGPIAGLGLRPGDTLVSLNGQPLTNEQEFLRALLADNVRGQQLSLVINRDGANQAIQVTPANLLQGLVQADPLFQSGVLLDSADPNRVVVQRVFPRTPAYYAGLRTGDVLLSASGQRLANAADFQRALGGPAGSIPLQVSRAGVDRNLTLNSIQAAPARGMFPNSAFNQPTQETLSIGQPRIGSPLFPNRGPTAPASGVPGSTQRVPVNIPGATTPAAGNPLPPRAIANPSAPSGAAPGGAAVGGAPR